MAPLWLPGNKRLQMLTKMRGRNRRDSAPNGGLRPKQTLPYLRARGGRNKADRHPDTQTAGPSFPTVATLPIWPFLPCTSNSTSNTFFVSTTSLDCGSTHVRVLSLIGSVYSLFYGRLVRRGRSIDSHQPHHPTSPHSLHHSYLSLLPLFPVSETSSLTWEVHRASPLVSQLRARPHLLARFVPRARSSVGSQHGRCH